MALSAFTTLFTLLLLSLSAIARPPPITTYNLPGNTTFPEGIAHHPNSAYFYTGSFTDGTIYRGNVRTPQIKVFIPASPDRPTVAGMKLDSNGRLYVAGGTSGTLLVYNTTTRALLHRFSNNLNGTLLNDLAIADDGTVYVTDSFIPNLYYVTRDKLDGPVDQELEVFSTLDGIFLQGEFNSNGIVVTQDQQYLIVGDWISRSLYRVCLSTGGFSLIDLGGKTIGNTDGLLLRGSLLGSLLYSVSSGYSLGIFIDVIKIEKPYLKATPIRRITSPLLVGPATAAWDGDDLLVTNFQAGSTAPVLPFTVVRVSTK